MHKKATGRKKGLTIFRGWKTACLNFNFKYPLFTLILPKDHNVCLYILTQKENGIMGKIWLKVQE